MKIDSHKASIKESMEELQSAVNRGVEDRQKTIGFHCSSASVNILEIYLHTKNLVDPGFQLKHNDFGSEKMGYDKLPFDFENKETIINLLVKIERKRNTLCYGKQQPKPEIEKFMETFNKLRDLLNNMGAEYE